MTRLWPCIAWGPRGYWGAGWYRVARLRSPGTPTMRFPPTSPHNFFRYSASEAGMSLKVKRIETSVTQSIVVEGAGGTLVELLPSTRTQGLLISSPSPAVLASDVIAFDYGDSTYTLESLTRVNYNTFLGQFTVS